LDRRVAHEGRARYCYLHMHVGSQVTLRREPDNSHDPMAVMVTYRRHCGRIATLN
jgi:hypothetical protein